ncbi:MAG TPA: copper resistance CopC family protein [Kineosporiaceae bacterium]|nr:copper resistance CopC family protein [Kineosporiaceae bacterium]
MPESSFAPAPPVPGSVRRRARHPRPAVRRAAPSAGVLAALLTLLGWALWAPAASAHDELLDLQPGNKVVVTAPPTQVQLVFGAPVLKVGTQIRVTGPTGSVVSTGDVQIDGETVVEKLVTGLANGVYTVDWRVTSSDGHPVSGTYTFTLDTTKVSASTPAAATASASAQPAAPPSPSAATAGSSAGSRSGGGPSTGVVAGLAALAAVLAVGGIVYLRRRGGAAANHEGNPKK